MAFAYTPTERPCKLTEKKELVEVRGIEPLASALRTQRSPKLSYTPTR